MPFISAITGTLLSVTYDSAHHFFTAALAPGAAQTTIVELSLRPVLQYVVSGGQLRLTWPATPSAGLEKATTLSPQADWAPATNTVNVIGGRNVMAVDTSAGMAFFRLRD